MKDMIFNPKDIQRIMGITRDDYSSKVARGFIKATHKAPGSGTKNKYTYDDLLKIEIFVRLTHAGISNKQASETIFTKVVYAGLTTLNVNLSGSLVLTIYVGRIEQSLQKRIKEVFC